MHYDISLRNGNKKLVSMKKIAILVLLSFIYMAGISQGLNAYLTYSLFDTPGNKPYIETYLTINGRSIKYNQTEDGYYQGKVNVQVMFIKGDSIINFAKYDLSSPIITDTVNPNQNLIDIQRYGLPNGEYELEIKLKDLNGDGKELSSLDKFEINFPKSEMAYSDIELLSSYEKTDKVSNLSKNGYLLTPYVFNYYPEDVNKITFYSELYNSKDILGEEAFLSTTYIRPFEVDKKLDKYINRRRVQSDNVVVTLSSFDIAELPSGNYILVMEARNRNNELMVSKEVYFQRHNPSAELNFSNLMLTDTKNTFVDYIDNLDTLRMYIEYLNPISTDLERAFAKSLISAGDIEDMQRYFLNFWVDRNTLDPQMEWVEYLSRVNKANISFKAITIEGYRTDRGRVFLQYGQPNVISDHHFEPAAYPYEIWHYYRLGDQQNKKFVFYAHDVVTNDFQLIHSDAVGELNNYRWETIIYKRTWDPVSVDDAIIPSSWGSKATQSYTQPW